MRLLYFLSKFLRTRNGLGVVILGTSYYLLLDPSPRQYVGFVLGTTFYLSLEAWTHWQMHVNPNSPFYGTHGEHHDNPTPETGVPKLWVFVMYTVLLVLVWKISRPILSGVYLSTLSWLMMYEWIHFLCHCNYKPYTKLGWRIRVNHNKHHKLDDTKYYNLLWVKGTSSDSISSRH